VASATPAISFLTATSCNTRDALQACGTTQQCSVVVSAGAIPLVCDIMSSAEDRIAEQCMWLLGNIAGDCVSNRNQVLTAGALPLLIAAVDNLEMHAADKLPVLRNATWAISNLCRGKPAPNLDIISVVFPLLSRLLQNKDAEVLADACWAASYNPSFPSPLVTSLLLLLLLLLLIIVLLQVLH
jgi:importin subunit alpha-1